MEKGDKTAKKSLQNAAGVHKGVKIIAAEESWISSSCKDTHKVALEEFVEKKSLPHAPSSSLHTNQSG